MTCVNVSNDGGNGKNISLNLTLINNKYDYYLEFPGGICGMGACKEMNLCSIVGRTYSYTDPAIRYASWGDS